jgi:hypothetical protein
MDFTKKNSGRISGKKFLVDVMTACLKKNSLVGLHKKNFWLTSYGLYKKNFL